MKENDDSPILLVQGTRVDFLSGNPQPYLYYQKFSTQDSSLITETWMDREKRPVHSLISDSKGKITEDKYYENGTEIYSVIHTYNENGIEIGQRIVYSNGNPGKLTTMVYENGILTQERYADPDGKVLQIRIYENDSLGRPHRTINLSPEGVPDINGEFYFWAYEGNSPIASRITVHGGNESQPLTTLRVFDSKLRIYTEEASYPEAKVWQVEYVYNDLEIKK